MSKMYPSVAIIGAGPAGLLAAWGASLAGANDVKIFDIDPTYRPDRIFSLQFLHEPCDLEFAIRRIPLHYDTSPIRLADMGLINPGPTLRDSARQVYNQKLDRPLEDENSTRFLWESPVTVWSLRDAYSYLWNNFKSDLEQRTLSWEDITGTICRSWDIVINTAPLNKLLPDMEWPTREYGIVMGYSPIKDHPENTCFYNLEYNEPWYRATRLDNGIATEYTVRPGQVIVLPSESISGYRLMRKVVGAPRYPDLPFNLLLAGRWGTWRPKELTHGAYRLARHYVRELSAQII